MGLFSFTLYLLSFAQFLLSAAAAPYDGEKYDLIVKEPPDFVRPYVIPDLSGPAYVLINDVIRAPINNESSGGAFSLVQLNAQPCTYHTSNLATDRSTLTRCPAQ